MCELCNKTSRSVPLARRNVLKLVTATAVSLAAAPYMAAAKTPPKEPSRKTFYRPMVPSTA